MHDEIVHVYEEEKIKPFVNKLRQFSFEDLEKTSHFDYSVAQKNTDITFIEKNFSEFKRIELVQERKHKNQKISYDFYYRLDDGTYIIYSIAFEEKPVLINAFHVNRNFIDFKRKLLNAYKRKLIG